MSTPFGYGGRYVPSYMQQENPLVGTPGAGSQQAMGGKAPLDPVSGGPDFFTKMQEQDEATPGFVSQVGKEFSFYPGVQKSLIERPDFSFNAQRENALQSGNYNYIAQNDPTIRSKGGWQNPFAYLAGELNLDPKQKANKYAGAQEFGGMNLVNQLTNLNYDQLKQLQRLGLDKIRGAFDQTAQGLANYYGEHGYVPRLNQSQRAVYDRNMRAGGNQMTNLGGQQQYLQNAYNYILNRLGRYGLI